MHEISPWFGEGTASVAFGAPPWLKSVRMTATAHVYTSDGFAIAADGRQTLSSRLYGVDKVEIASDRVHKIFEVTGKTFALACSLKGEIATLDRAFDLGDALKVAVNRVRNRRTRSCVRLACFLANELEAVIREAMLSGNLEWCPSAELCFVGYLKANPCWFEILIRPSLTANGKLYHIEQLSLSAGLCKVSGSDTVKEAVERGFHGDPACKILPNDQTTLKEATEFATGYVNAAGSPWALSLDKNCIKIGGHTHVAVVLPPEDLRERLRRVLGLGSPKPITDFQWRIAPLPRESSI